MSQAIDLIISCGGRLYDTNRISMGCVASTAKDRGVDERYVSFELPRLIIRICPGPTFAHVLTDRASN